MGVKFYEKHTLKELSDLIYDSMNYFGVIAVFPLVVIHEYLHYIPSKIYGFRPEVRLLKEGEYPAYCRIQYNENDNKYKLIVTWLFPAFFVLYIMVVNYLTNNDRLLMYISFLLLTMSFIDILDAGYIFVYGIKKFKNRGT
jgi:hypothetical protein